MSKRYQYDVIIVGGGAAGMTLALQLPEQLSIALLAKSPHDQSSTYYAQGGVSAVLESNDSIELHVEDTLDAGAGLCDEKIVRQVAETGPAMIEWLSGLGMPFTRDADESAGGYHLTREGGHSRRRVAHAADATGKALQNTLLAHVAERSNIDRFEQEVAIDLITENGRCIGL